MADFDPGKTYTSVVNAGDDWADKEAAADLLEETKKSVLADLMIKASASTAAAKEMYALADPIYRTFIEGMVNARKAANKAKVRYDSARMLAEHRRSQEATERAKINLR